LNRFEITEDQIYAITLDNGSNIVRMVRLLRQLRQGEDKSEECQRNLDSEFVEVRVSEDDEDFILDEIEELEISQLQELQEKYMEKLHDVCSTEWYINSK